MFLKKIIWNLRIKEKLYNDTYVLIGLVLWNIVVKYSSVIFYLKKGAFKLTSPILAFKIFS